MDLGDCGERTSKAVLSERDCDVCRDEDGAGNETIASSS
jgi:hypothetical protein